MTCGSASPRHANAMTAELYAATLDVPGVEHDAAPAVNSLFPVLLPDLIEPLREWSFFWDWDPARHQVRWMTAWDTTPRGRPRLRRRRDGCHSEPRRRELTER